MAGRPPPIRPRMGRSAGGQPWQQHVRAAPPAVHAGPRPSAAFVCLGNSPWSGGGAGGVPGVRSFSKRVRRHRRERAGGFVVHEPTSLAHFRQMLVLAAVDHRGGPGGTAAEGAPWALPHPLVASTHQPAPVLHPATAVGRPVGRTAFGAEGCPEHVHAADRRRSPVLSRGWRQFGRNTLRPSGRARRPAFRGSSRGFRGRPGARCDRIRILRALAGRFPGFR